MSATKHTSRMLSTPGKPKRGRMVLVLTIVVVAINSLFAHLSLLSVQPPRARNENEQQGENEISSSPWNPGLIQNNLQQVSDPPPPRVCPCCGFTGSQFTEFNKRADRRCPRCNAVERHRKFCAIMHCDSTSGGLTWAKRSSSSSSSHPNDSFRLLHFGPHRSMYDLINTIEPPVDHVALDYFAPGYEEKYDRSLVSHGDVTNLTYADNSVDGVVILHVLEHVGDLHRAFSELKRVLRTNGWAYVEVPCWTFQVGKSVDCRNTSDRSERVSCSGQFDHVWRFDCDDFQNYLTNEGFQCEILNQLDGQHKCLGNALRKSIKTMHSESRAFPSYLCHKK